MDLKLKFIFNIGGAAPARLRASAAMPRAARRSGLLSVLMLACTGVLPVAVPAMWAQSANYADAGSPLQAVSFPTILDTVPTPDKPAPASTSPTISGDPADPPDP